MRSVCKGVFLLQLVVCTSCASHLYTACLYGMFTDNVLSLCIWGIHTSGSCVRACCFARGLYFVTRHVMHRGRVHRFAPFSTGRWAGVEIFPQSSNCTARSSVVVVVESTTFLSLRVDRKMRYRQTTDDARRWVIMMMNELDGFCWNTECALVGQSTRTVHG